MRLRELPLEAGRGSPQKSGRPGRDRAAAAGQRGMHRGIRSGIDGEMTYAGNRFSQGLKVK